MGQKILTFLLSFLLLMVLIVVFLFLITIKEKIDQRRIMREKTKKMEKEQEEKAKKENIMEAIKEYIKEKEHEISDIRCKKEPLLIVSDEYEEFSDLLRFAEYELWRLEEAVNLLNKYKSREDLYRLHHEKDQEYEKAKGKRNIITILGFSIAYYFILYRIEEPTGIGIILTILPAVFIAGIHFLINMAVFIWLNSKGHDESEYLNYLKSEIKKLEDEIKGYPRPTAEYMNRCKENVNSYVNELKSMASYENSK